MDLLAIAGTILGLVGLSGGVVGYFAKSRGDSIIEYQAREIALRDGTIARLEKDNATLSAKCDSQAEQIDTLKELAQGSPQLVTLTTEIKALISYIKDNPHKASSRRRKNTS